MTDRTLAHRRTHNLLLIQKLLSCKSGASPFTLVLDSVEQGSKGVVGFWVEGAKASKIPIIYISYETLKPPPGTTIFIKARRRDFKDVQKEVASHLVTAKPTLLILETLHPLLSLPPPHTIPSLLAPLLTPSTTLLATFHTDIPIPIPIPPSQNPPLQNPTHHQNHNPNPYAPSPLTLLTYLATTILTPLSLPQYLASHTAARKSRPPPTFGLGEEMGGVLVGRGANATNAAGGSISSRKVSGCIIKLEHRRISGRSVSEIFWFPPPGDKEGMAKVTLLDDHPLFLPTSSPDTLANTAISSTSADGNETATFSLELSDKQRRDREAVVLPYFDAQRAELGGRVGVNGEEGGGNGDRGGIGEGSRILYQMGVEDMDDFDEEEDEI